MNLPNQQQVHTMVFRATSNELIALGHVVTQYITQMRRIPNPTKEQLEIVALLKSFQGRLVQDVPHQPAAPQGR